MSGRHSRLFRFRYMLGLGVLIGGASLAQPLAAPAGIAAVPNIGGVAADLSVMTFNVKGLPWPVASDREEPLRHIGDRLALMRAEGKQPAVVVLQEAFTTQAKAIGDLAGYPYQAHGPYVRRPLESAASAQMKWYRGETQAPPLDSGLIVLSDWPITEIRRAAFPPEACAGYDCLAAKGVLLVTLETAQGTVTVATSHLNSRGASGAPVERTSAAYAAQVRFMADFLRANWRRDSALVLAGDFNRGQRPDRMAILHDGVAELAAGGTAQEALSYAIRRNSLERERMADAKWIEHRARDMQFVFDGEKVELDPVGGTIPFGTEADGSTLSDHMGYTIHYRFTSRRPQITLR